MCPAGLARVVTADRVVLAVVAVLAFLAGTLLAVLFPAVTVFGGLSAAAASNDAVREPRILCTKSRSLRLQLSSFCTGTSPAR